MVKTTKGNQKWGGGVDTRRMEICEGQERGKNITEYYIIYYRI